jgi:hypothetical protein
VFFLVLGTLTYKKLSLKVQVPPTKETTFSPTHKIKNCIQRGKRIWVIYCGTGVHLEEKKYIIIGISSKSA